MGNLTFNPLFEILGVLVFCFCGFLSFFLLVLFWGRFSLVVVLEQFCSLPAVWLWSWELNAVFYLSAPPGTVFLHDVL